MWYFQCRSEQSMVAHHDVTPRRKGFTQPATRAMRSAYELAKITLRGHLSPFNEKQA